jgi:hypothetical protein
MNAKHCNETNPDLFSDFSDLYKEVHGMRPRGFYTETEVNGWMPYLREESARQVAAYLEERAFDESIEKGTHPAFTTPDARLTFSPFTGWDSVIA